MIAKELFKYKKLTESIQALFEINFNNRQLIQNAMNADIHCGFEVEVIMPHEGITDEDVANEIDQLSWNDIDHMVHHMDRNRVIGDYHTWLQEQSEFDEQFEARLDEMVDYDFEIYAEDWFDENDGGELEVSDDQMRSEAIIKYIKDNDREEEYRQWLRERLLDESSGDIVDEVIVYMEGSSRYSVDEFIDENWGSMHAMCVEYGIEPHELGLETDDEDLSGVSDKLSNELNIPFKTEKSYGQIDIDESTSYWVVGPDSSIDVDSGEIGAEIKSLVFDSPAQMMSNLERLFNVLNRMEARADSSTGLHITMSWGGEEQETNRVKMALLSGDEYTLSKFDRLNNTYARSLYRKILDSVDDKNLPSTPVLKDIEHSLDRLIQQDKFRTIHFKGIKNELGNSLIEFRAAGGRDYIDKIDDIRETVSRYAILMQAGHDPEFEKESYAKALLKVLGSNFKDIEDDTAEPIKTPVPPGATASFQGTTYTYSEDSKWVTTGGKVVRKGSRLDNILNNLSQSGDKETKIRPLNVNVKSLVNLSKITDTAFLRSSLITIQSHIHTINRMIQNNPDLMDIIEENQGQRDALRMYADELKDEIFKLFRQVCLRAVQLKKPLGDDMPSETKRTLRKLFLFADIKPDDIVEALVTMQLDQLQKNFVRKTIHNLTKIKVDYADIYEIKLDDPRDQVTNLILKVLFEITLLQDSPNKDMLIDAVSEAFPDVDHLLHLATFTDIKDMRRTLRGLLPDFVEEDVIDLMKHLDKEIQTKYKDSLPFDVS